jgi:hypothetical protein
MDLQTYIDNAVKASRANTLANSDQLTLGELILKTEIILKDLKGRNEEATVRYDFEYLFPTSIDSWRGSYNELALNYKSEGEEMSVSDFLQMLKDCIGKTFTGYKGGEYKMNRLTPVWVANYGRSGNTAVIDVVDAGWFVMLVTGYRQF